MNIFESPTAVGGMLPEEQGAAKTDEQVIKDESEGKLRSEILKNFDEIQGLWGEMQSGDAPFFNEAQKIVDEREDKDPDKKKQLLESISKRRLEVEKDNKQASSMFSDEYFNDLKAFLEHIDPLQSADVVESAAGALLLKLNALTSEVIVNRDFAIKNVNGIYAQVYRDFGYDSEGTTTRMDTLCPEKRRQDEEHEVNFAHRIGLIRQDVSDLTDKVLTAIKEKPKNKPDDSVETII